MRRSQPHKEAEGCSGKGEIACSKALRQKRECGWSVVWEGEAGARPHKDIIGLTRSVDFIPGHWKLWKGFKLSSDMTFVLKDFPSCCVKNGLQILDTGVVGRYADGVVNDGGDSGSGKKQVGWRAGVSRGGWMRMTEELKMTEHLSG